MQDSGRKQAPRHYHYGYGDLQVGESVVITPIGGDNITKLRGHIYSYANYYGKEFATKKEGWSSLRVERLK